MDKKQVGWLIAVAVLAVVTDRTVLFWSGEDGPLPTDAAEALGHGAPALRHQIEPGDDVIEEKDHSTVIEFTQTMVDFTHPGRGATALLRKFKKGYFVDVANRGGGPVILSTEEGWLIAGNPTLTLQPGYRCTLLSEGDGFEILVMSNKP